MDDFWLHAVLFLAALAAGFVDAIAGGGGLITVPVLLWAGLPEVDALATNKLQSSFGSASAVAHYARAGLIDVRACALGMVVAFLAAAGGALAVTHLDRDFLRWAIPFLLLAIALYTGFRPRLGEASRQPRLPAAVFAIGFGVLLGFYDGFFGPGTGSFWTIAYVLVQGLDLRRATAHTKSMNFASNIFSLACFLTVGRGHLHWSAGLVMGVGQWLGARLGARLVITRGTRFIRPVFLSVVIALTLKLLWDRLRLSDDDSM